MKTLIFSLLITVILPSCGGGNQKPATQPEEQKPLTSKNSEAFNQSFEKVLSSYDAVKNALVEYDTAAANTAATELTVDAKGVQVNEIQGDSTGVIKETATSYLSAIQAASQDFTTEKQLDKKKRIFASISDAMYDLTRTVKYDKQKIYHQHCPMAFNDNEEAYWISTSDEVINPYLGKKHPKYKGGMLHCGDITDSLDFRH